MSKWTVYNNKIYHKNMWYDANKMIWVLSTGCERGETDLLEKQTFC